ncbi:MAG: hypothetical protein LBR96_07695 [Treponema sp.]|jgi:hypothetical protein|nr:hypothetical protein [Treponema sp.]
MNSFNPDFFAKINDKMNTFNLDSFAKINADRKLFSSTTVKFDEETVTLYDGFEFDDADGDNIHEQDEYYTIYCRDIDKILSVMPDEYKNKSILSEYNGAGDYYDAIREENKKMFFLCILKCYKLGDKFNHLLKPLEENGIYYQFKESRY